MSLKSNIAKVRLLKRSPGSRWIIERRSLDILVGSNETGFHPEAVVCVSSTEEAPLGATLLTPGNEEQEILPWAIECMLNPSFGRPRRPESVSLSPGLMKGLEPFFRDLGVRVATLDSPEPLVDEVLEMVKSEFTEQRLEPLYTDVRGVKPETVAEFFEAAAQFYKAKPWKLFEYEEVARIVIEGAKPVKYWPVVMGIEGNEFGMTVFRSPNEIVDACFEDEDEEAFGMLEDAWKMGFNYEDIDDIGEPAESEMQRNKWTLAGKAAYPSAIVHDPKADTVGRPAKKQLEDLTAIVKAYTEFIRRHRKLIGKEDTVLADTIDVVVAGRELRTLVDLPAPEYLEREEEESEYDDEEEQTYGMLPFFFLFPEIAAKETRTATIGAGSSVPPREYAFLESYCTDPDCDCRRTLVQVRSEGAPSPLAVISYGWESREYYRKRGHTDGPDPTVPMLDPLFPNSEYSAEFLDIFKTCVQDPNYVARLKQHYDMFKKEIVKRKS